MALQVSLPAQMLLFKSVFGSDSAVTQAVEELITKHGFKVDVGLFQVTFVKGSYSVQVGLTTGSSALIKNTANPTVKAQCAAQLKKMVQKVWADVSAGKVAGVSPHVVPNLKDVVSKIGDEVNGKTLSEVLQNVPGWEKKEPPAETLGDLLKSKLVPGLDVPASKPAKPAKPKSSAAFEETAVVGVPDGEMSKVLLKDATDIGQPVFGTSAGSTYYTVALGPVNVAVRVESSSLSIRVEPKGGAFSASDSTAVGKVCSVKKTYASVHVSTYGCPPEKVIGSLLFSMGLHFDKIATGKFVGGL